MPKYIPNLALRANDKKVVTFNNSRAILEFAMQTPKFSIITVSLNQGEFIRENIESVLRQGHPNFEHLVIDGGSTDETISVLKEYPHLKWTSEPDSGQSNALNKGIERARGEIIGWLNSDDMYADNVFKEVEALLSEYPVILGACERIDRKGSTTELVRNIERSWFDMLKYWVHHAIPDQPSIFFKKYLLDTLRRADDKVFDEGLEFCMDLDLWLRMAKNHPFSKRINKTLSYYRMYETNKTGRSMVGTYEEASRLFSRYSKKGCEASVSIIVEVEGDFSALNRLGETLEGQSLKDFEIIFLALDRDRNWNQEVKSAVDALLARFEMLRGRVHFSKKPSIIGALNEAVELSSAHIFALMPSGSEITSNFVLEVINLFSQDSTGLAFPESLCDFFPTMRDRDRGGLKIASAFEIFHVPHCLLCRKVAWEDCGGFYENSSFSYSIRDFLLQLSYGGWFINTSNKINISGLKLDASEVATEDSVNFNEKIISRLRERKASDPFYEVRNIPGFGILVD